MLDGRLSLTTPEGVRLQLSPAGPHLRAVAWGIDFLIWCAMVWALYAITPRGPLGQGLFYVGLFITYWGYPIICEVCWGGRTAGKRAVGLEVVRSDGLPVGWRESTVRNLLLVADFMPVMYATGLMCMLLDRQFRRLGDIVAGTQVVYREKALAPPVALEAEPLAAPFPLSADQQRTLADLFERAARLPEERLAELGTLAEPITGCTGADSVARLRGIVAGFSQ